MAQTEAAKKAIDGVEFTVYKLDPTISYRLSRRLGAVLAPTIGAAIGKASAADLTGLDVDLEKATGEFFNRLDEKLLDDLVKTFGEVSHADGKPVKDVFAILFRGKVDVMFEWLAFCLSVEYEGVLKKARSGIGRVALLRQMQGSESPPT